MQLFEAKFDPWFDPAADRAALVDEHVNRIRAALEQVPADEDRMLRQFLSVLLAVVRTNYYQPDDTRCPAVLPVPDAARWHSSCRPSTWTSPTIANPSSSSSSTLPQVEGVHLRYGPVARGGIRWSDRAEDYRTEVLDLVRAQTVKNAIISRWAPRVANEAVGRSELADHVSEGRASYAVLHQGPAQGHRHDCGRPAGAPRSGGRLGRL